MKEFIRKHEDHIHGALSCFDRRLFRGYLPIMSGWAMVQFLNGLDVKGSSLKRFLLESSERVKDHISGTTTSRRRNPESPHDPLCQMQRSHGERIYARPSPEAQAGNAPRTFDKTRSAAEGQGDKMIRVVTLDPFEEKEIQKFCRKLYASFGVGCEHAFNIEFPDSAGDPPDAAKLLEQVKGVRSFRYAKAGYLTKRKLKDRNLQTGAASTCGYSIYGKTLALVSTHPKKDIDEGFRYVSRVAVYHVGHLWGLHHCLDPRCSM